MTHALCWKAQYVARSDLSSKIMASSVVAVFLGIVVKLFAMGWNMCFGVLLYPVVFLAHLLIHRYAALSPGRLARVLRFALISDVLLLIAMLVQYDYNESVCWITISAYLEDLPPLAGHHAAVSALIRRYGVMMSLVSLLVVCLSWIPLLRFGVAARRSTAAGLCEGCGYPFGSNVRCSECGRPSAPLED